MSASGVTILNAEADLFIRITRLAESLHRALAEPPEKGVGFGRSSISTPLDWLAWLLSLFKSVAVGAILAWATDFRGTLVDVWTAAELS